MKKIKGKYLGRYYDQKKGKKMPAKIDEQTVTEHKTISEEIRFKKARFSGHAMRMDIDSLTRKLRKITRRTRVKPEIKWIIEGLD